MKLSALQTIKEMTCVQTVFDDSDIVTGYTSDLLSDVMANADEQSALITIQAHKNTIAVCQLAGIKAVIICNGRDIPTDMMQAAKQEKIAIFKTEKSQFDMSHILYEALKRK